MESDNLDPSVLEEALKKEDEWAKTVIFDENLNIICHKNC